MPLADIGAEFLFQVISERAERAAIIVTTNLPFSEWTTVFPNPRLCKALLDRITDRARFRRTRSRSHGDGESDPAAHHDGQEYWLAQKRLSGGKFTWWPETEPASPRGIVNLGLRRQALRALEEENRQAQLTMATDGMPLNPLPDPIFRVLD